MLLAGLSYYILEKVIVAAQGKHSVLARAVAKDIKEKLSIGLYAAAIPLAFYDHRLSGAIYLLVALMWLVPDKRIEKMLKSYVLLLCRFHLI
jgi:uncharacterized membrane protein